MSKNLDSTWVNHILFESSYPFISNPLPQKSEEIVVSLWVEKGSPIKKIVFSSSTAGDFSDTEMKSEPLNDFLDCYRITYKPLARHVYFNFVLITDTDRVFFIDKEGVHEDVSAPDGLFELVTDFQIPKWAHEAVFYQIFPDRFFKGKDIHVTPYSDNGCSRIEHKQWNEDPYLWNEARCLDFFGGNLDGIRKKIPYLKQLGINALYLTPIFKAPSNHKYDTEDYFEIDPSFGDKEDLVALVQELHENGIRIILDGVLNHTGDRHVFFNKQKVYGDKTGAYNNKECAEYEYYFFFEHPNDYYTWANVSNLPCLNYKSQKLRDTMYRSKTSVIRTYLSEPYNIDGWRLDVVGEVGNYKNEQLNEQVLRELRCSVKDNYKEKFLLGEVIHRAHDFLQGDKLDSIMSYEGMTRPIWGFVGNKRTLVWNSRWYERSDPGTSRAEIFDREVCGFLRSLPAGVSNHQSNFICNHDTPRIRHIVGEDAALQKIAVVFQFTFPGIPFVYYGDEAGLSGAGDPMNRRTFPWDRIDADLLSFYRSIIQLRKENASLTRGAFRKIFSEKNTFAFARILDDKNISIIVLNSGEQPIILKLDTRKAGVYNAEFRSYFSECNYLIKNGELPLEIPGKNFEILIPK